MEEKYYVYCMKNSERKEIKLLAYYEDILVAMEASQNLAKNHPLVFIVCIPSYTIIPIKD